MWLLYPLRRGPCFDARQISVAVGDGGKADVSSWFQLGEKETQKEGGGVLLVSIGGGGRGDGHGAWTDTTFVHGGVLPGNLGSGEEVGVASCRLRARPIRRGVKDRRGEGEVIFLDQ